MKELVTQAASNTLGAGERTAIKSELTELTSEIGDIVSETQFNSVALIDGTYTGKSFQTGEGTADTLTFSIIPKPHSSSHHRRCRRRRHHITAYRQGKYALHRHHQHLGDKGTYPRCRYRKGTARKHKTPDTPANRYSSARSGECHTSKRPRTVYVN